MLTKRDRTAMYKGLQELRRIRIANVQAAARSAGGVAALAHLCGVSSAFLYQIAGEHPVRNIGEKLARKLEQDLGVPAGWLDSRH